MAMGVLYAIETSEGIRVKLLALDPSVHGTGAAYFEGLPCRLKRVGLWDTKLKTQTRSYGEIARRGGSQSHGLYREIDTLDMLVCEVPQIYKSSPGDPNDLVAVAMVAGALCAVLPTKKIETFWPAEWKGQVPKPVHHKRIIGKLSPDELAILDKARLSSGAAVHNILDAIGLGVWHLERTSLRS